MFDSRQCEKRLPITVCFKNVSYASDFKEVDFTYSKLKYWFVVPLVMLNIGTSEYTCVFGKSSIDRDVLPFVRESVEKECNRSGCFRLTSPDSASYDLSVSISNYRSVGPYGVFFYMYFFMYVYGFGYNHTAVPGESQVVLKMTLTGRDGSVYEKEFNVLKESLVLKGRNDVRELRRNYTNSMIEALSMSFKESIEDVVKSINDHFVGKE